MKYGVRPGPEQSAREAFMKSRKASARAVKPLELTRRGWLAGAFLLGLGAVGRRARADEPKAAGASDSAAEESIRSRAKAAGLKLAEFGTNRTDHYLAVGNAPSAFRADALDLCEKLAATYLAAFKAKGFESPLPQGRMAVVVLADRESYEGFKGEPAGPAEGGHYDIEADRLVMYDFRTGGAINAGANSTRLNTFTLVHEAVHQLTFDTGLLSTKADVPVVVSEGLATYGESWQKVNPTIGRVNTPRLQVLKKPGGGEWIPIGELLVRDELFNGRETEQYAYAEAWLLIYTFMKTAPKAAKLRAYLDRLKMRREPDRRVEDAEAALGNLESLDRELKKTARGLI
jgi:hypothetical protein